MRADISQAKLPGFFRFSPLKSTQRRQLEKWKLPPSYLAFLREFGEARMFRELRRESHSLLVQPPDQWEPIPDFPSVLDIGGFSSSVFLLRIDELRAGREVPVYSTRGGSLVKRADSFADLLGQSWSLARRTYGPRKWKQVVEGLPPFTDAEQRIVDIRSKFRWRALPPAKGELRVEIFNGSQGSLDHYTIGVRDSHPRGMVGAFWANVSSVKSGQTRALSLPLRGYDGLLTVDSAVLFKLGPPRPETRDDYSEFKCRS